MVLWGLEILHFCSSNTMVELVNLLQQKEKDMRPGGRENYVIKIIESAGNQIEGMLVNVDPFNGNKCENKKCVL